MKIKHLEAKVILFSIGLALLGIIILLDKNNIINLTI